MRDEVVAKRYAQALFNLGEENDLLDIFVDEFNLIKDVLKENKQLFSFLKHPQVTQNEKQQFVETVFVKFHKHVKNTILLLVQRQRIDAAPSIVKQLNELINDAKGIADAIVHSVRPLTEEEETALAKEFTERLNQTSVVFNNVVDPDILGGLRIQIGNTIYDGTVRSKLNRIERSIATANK